MKKIQISIPTPCHQSWAEMTPTEKGKFCAMCQKNVVDFTNMSDAEVVTYLSAAKGNVCGRYQVSQLDRELVGQRVAFFRVPYLSTLFLGSGLLLGHQNSFAQLAQAPMTQNATTPQDSVKRIPEPQKGRIGFIEGVRLKCDRALHGHTRGWD